METLKGNLIDRFNGPQELLSPLFNSDESGRTLNPKTLNETFRFRGTLIKP